MKGEREDEMDGGREERVKKENRDNWRVEVTEGGRKGGIEGEREELRGVVGCTSMYPALLT